MVEVIWEVDDGYVGAARPQSVERKEHIESIVNERFLSEINWEVKDYGLDVLQKDGE